MTEKQFKEGLIHVYTGDGKGKTTAAIGQGIRTAGYGYKVLMVQFLKGHDTGELYSIEKLAPDFKIIRLGAVKGFFANLTDDEKKFLRKDIANGLEKVKQCIMGGEFSLIILDEIFILMKLKLVDADKIINLIKNKPACIEIILTGRGATEEFIQAADYVTEMKMIKHPFEKGIKAREGIEY